MATGVRDDDGDTVGSVDAEGGVGDGAGDGDAGGGTEGDGVDGASSREMAV
jgi:hypothetical protein